MKILELEQRSPDWYAARSGVPTASNFDKIITTTGTQSKQRTKYMYQLAGERLGAVVDETYQSFAMTQGIEKEGDARLLYEMAKGSEVGAVGFCLSDCGKYGCSPDGLIGDDGGVEIKCPLLSTHVDYLLNSSDEVPSDYYQQVQGSLFVTGRKWWDFVSYYPGIKPLIIREYPDENFQRLLKKELDLFCLELDQMVEKIK